jgi:hypothetical protein
MERKELVAKAVAAGITKAHSIKSVVLEEMLKGMKVTKSTGKRGRPIIEDSERQKRLKLQEEKRANGTLKKGRPVNEESVRQIRLKDLEMRRANGTLKRGRPKKEQ